MENIGTHLPPVHGALVPIPRSTFYEHREQPKRATVSPIVGEIIAKLGLRYRPSGTADLEAHAEALILLAEDCADIPPPLLDRAAKQWAREERFMPRASELRRLARDIQSDDIAGSDHALHQLQAHCDKLNESEVRMNTQRRWRVAGEAPRREVASYQLGHAA